MKYGAWQQYRTPTFNNLWVFTFVSKKRHYDRSSLIKLASSFDLPLTLLYMSLALFTSLILFNLSTYCQCFLLSCRTKLDPCTFMLQRRMPNFWWGPTTPPLSWREIIRINVTKRVNVSILPSILEYDRILYSSLFYHIGNNIRNKRKKEIGEKYSQIFNHRNFWPERKDKNNL